MFTYDHEDLQFVHDRELCQSSKDGSFGVSGIVNDEVQYQLT